MCGLAGIIDYKSVENSEKTVEEMLAAISYRGPDESGIYKSRYAAIGNVRLSIIDIAGGQQPMTDPSGRFWIVYNGEIFNYRELRKDLESKGFKFRTLSDTEVLLQYFILHGKKCLNFFNGQFVFAIWDLANEELFLARDRVGIRPLFYNFNAGVLTFASEIKSLFKHRRISREFSSEGLSQVYTFWTTLTPRTAFRDIFELSPGHFMTFSRKGINTGKYWELSFGKISALKLNDAAEHFHELFLDAVNIRLRADVEVAAYLSGGIDSSATVAYIKNINPGILHTFSIGFEESDFDETAYQNEAIGYFRTNHQSLKCTNLDIAENFPDVISHSEIPLTRTAPTPMLLLSRLVRENNIKVVITGEGSDELLAGYNIFKEGKVRRFWSAQPKSKIRPLLLTRLYPYLPQMKTATPNMLKMFFGFKLEEVENPFYSHLLRWNNGNHIKKHLTPDLAESLKNYSPVADLEQSIPVDFSSWDHLAKSQWLETTIFMSGYLLSSQGDRMAMANSVEGRYPFLDYRLIEFCSSLPPDYKLNGLNEKYLLKKVVSDKIPESILKRPKQAYRAPVRNVFFSGKTPEFVREMLSKRQTEKTGVFNYDTLYPLWSKIEKSGQSTEIEDMLLTSVISTHLLFHQFIESTLPVKGKLKNLKIILDSEHL